MVFLKTLYKFDNYMDNNNFCMYDDEKIFVLGVV